MTDCRPITHTGWNDIARRWWAISARVKCFFWLSPALRLLHHSGGIFSREIHYLLLRPSLKAQCLCSCENGRLKKRKRMIMHSATHFSHRGKTIYWRANVKKTSASKTDAASAHLLCWITSHKCKNKLSVFSFLCCSLHKRLVIQLSRILIAISQLGFCFAAALQKTMNRIHFRRDTKR